MICSVCMCYKSPVNKVCSCTSYRNYIVDLPGLTYIVAMLCMTSSTCATMIGQRNNNSIVCINTAG